MDQAQDQLKLKQQLLQTEILNKNLDHMKFLQFCVSQKENGDDLNNWSYEELKQCIQNFKESLKPKEPTSQSSSLNFFLSAAKSNPQPQIYQPNTYYYQNPSITNSNSFQQLNQNIPTQNIPQGPALISTTYIFHPLQAMLSSAETQERINKDVQEVSIDPKTSSLQSQKIEIICKKLEKSVLNDKEIKVLVQNPKTTEKTLLTTQFTIYEVCTESMKWLVHRRYSDFDWLRNILCKFFPRIVIPPLPPKKIGTRRFEQDFIEKRMQFLQ